MKPLSSQIADLQRELENLEELHRKADEEWRAVDVEYVKETSARGVVRSQARSRLRN